MKCFVLFSIVVFAASQLECSAEDFSCKAGVSYIENDCNNCFCTPDGELGCTLKACPNVDSVKLHNCEVGTSFDKACNKCWCVKEKGTICTNNDC